MDPKSLCEKWYTTIKEAEEARQELAKFFQGFPF